MLLRRQPCEPYGEQWIACYVYDVRGFQKPRDFGALLVFGNETPVLQLYQIRKIALIFNLLNRHTVIDGDTCT